MNNNINSSMSLQELLNLSEEHGQKIGLSEERLHEQLDNLRNLIAFFREYPDIFVDFIKKDDSNCTFNFYFYQRIFLRIAMRHRYVYATFPRAYSKSFLSMMVLFIRAILYPNSELFVTTGGEYNKILIVIIQ